MASEGVTNLEVTIKGPSDLKFAVSVPPSATVLELKGIIAAADSTVAVEHQRLIYSGRVLKDEDPVSKYSLKSGNTVHLVKGAKPPPPPAGASSAAAGVPNSFAAGNEIMGNPLAPLLAAQNAGALGGFNPFQGYNTNDPDLMGQMMRDPATQAQLGNLLNDPAVLDQIIQSNPELRAMGPQVRELMRSEQFRSFLTDPAAMGQMRQMMQAGGGMPPGMAGMMGGAQGGAAPSAQGAGGPLFNPWAANTPDAGATANQGLGGMGAGGMPDFARMMAQMGAGGGGMGAFGGAPALGAGPVMPPEERYQDQLAQLADMGFHDAARNVRALLATGGNVQGAVEYLFSMP